MHESRLKMISLHQFIQIRWPWFSTAWLLIVLAAYMRIIGLYSPTRGCHPYCNCWHTIVWHFCDLFNMICSYFGGTFQSNQKSRAQLFNSYGATMHLNSQIHPDRIQTTITTFKAHLKTELFTAAYTTQSNISSAAGASDSNSRHTAPPINVFDIDIDGRTDGQYATYNVTFYWESRIIQRDKQKSFHRCRRRRVP